MIPHSTKTSLLTSATDDEIHVAQILLHISTMIPTLDSGSGLKWGSKKRRSRSDEVPSPYHKNDDVEYEKPPPPPKAEMEAAATASPVTPLAFPPSESDDHKSKNLFKKTSKNNRLKEEYIDMIEDLSQRRDLLKEEIANVTNYHNKLIAFNSQLKALKQEALNYRPRKEEPKLESSKDRNLATELTPKNYKMIMEIQTHPQPLVEDQMAEIFPSSYFEPNSAQFYLPNNDGLRSINHVGPIGIPDLNVSPSAEEMDQYQPLDRSTGDRRARSAEARRRRRDIIRVKSMRNASVVKFPRIR